MPTLTHADALALTAAAVRIATEREIPLSVVVVDSHGHVVSVQRMDGASFVTTDVATGKAWTAAAWRQDSAREREKAAKLPQFAGALSAQSGGLYTPQTGAVVLRRAGEVVGAIGASGSTGEIDEEIVAAAVAEVFGS